MNSDRNVWKDYYLTKFRSGAPISYIIACQVLIFVLGYLSPTIEKFSLEQLSLPVSFTDFLAKPWSLFTYPFVNQSLFQLLFDSLWLYWMGTLFLNLLNKRQFLFLYVVAACIGAVAFLTLGQIPYLNQHAEIILQTGANGIGAVVASLLLLIPRSEIRLLLLGTVRFRIVGFIYLLLQFGFYFTTSQIIALSYLVVVFWGFVFMYLLQSGNDLSSFLGVKKTSKLKVVHRDIQTKKSEELPSQEIVDHILDKISQSGYESLSQDEKETLFKLSNQKQ